MVVHVLSLLAAGGFGNAIGRFGRTLLSDEEVHLAWMLQEAGIRCGMTCASPSIIKFKPAG